MCLVLVVVVDGGWKSHRAVSLILEEERAATAIKKVSVPRNTLRPLKQRFVHTSVVQDTSFPCLHPNSCSIHKIDFFSKETGIPFRLLCEICIFYYNDDLFQP